MSEIKSVTHCGIDFGTTNSSISISQSHKSKIIPIDRSNKNQFIVRSLIYIDPHQKVSIGSEAINRYLYDLNTLPTVPLRQELTGRMIKVMVPTGSGPMIASWVPEIIEVDDSGRGRLLQSLKSVLTSSSFTGTDIFGQFYSLEFLLSLLLKKIKTNAELELDYELSSVVIGRPVRYVGHSENKIALDRMTKIAKNVGFKHVEFEYEPVGAALDYGFNLKDNRKILVFDFGGGTLDVCIMKFPEKEILAVSGRGIGGDLLNTRLIQSKLLHHFGSTAIINGHMPFPKHFFSAFESWYQTTLQKDVKNLNALEELAIKSDQPRKISNLKNLIANDYGFEFFQIIDNLKISLSRANNQNFRFKHHNIFIEENITRSDFEESINEELTQSYLCIFETLNQAGLKPQDIDKVILTGGSSQVPIFIEQIKKIFTPQKIVSSNRFTSVAAGLSLRAEEIFT